MTIRNSITTRRGSSTTPADDLGRIRGRLIATMVAASAVGPLAFTILADITNSYTTAATTAAALPLTVAALPLTVAAAASIAPLPHHRPT